MSKPPAGVSRRAYATSRGISEAVVRKYLKEGKLSEALLPNGQLDAAKADQLLAASLTRGKSQSVSLATAKVRRVRAQVRKLNDELDGMRRMLITPADGARMLEEDRQVAIRHLRSIAVRIAPGVAGVESKAAFLTLRTVIFDTLNVMQPDPGTETELDTEEDEEELDLDGLGETDLLAIRINLQAEKLELERARDKGQLVAVQDMIETYEEHLGICKSLLMALPNRVAVQMEGSTVEQAQALIEAEIELAIEALNQGD